MRTQVNSDRSVAVDARLKAFVKGEVERILENFEGKLTRVEVHLSDVNSTKEGPADKRCLVEARPAAAKPITTSATADTMAPAIDQALKKMKRALTSFFGRQGRAGGRGRPDGKSTSTRRVGKVKTTRKAAAPAVATKAAPKKAAKPRAVRVAAVSTDVPAQDIGATSSPKKKPIFQARRKAWPSR